VALDIASFEKLAWELSLVLQAVLLGTLVARGLHRRFPILSVYLALNLLQSVFLLIVYPLAGFHSRFAWVVGWASHGIVAGAKALAVGELCHHVLASYRGIWALGWRVLTAGAVTVLVFAIAFGRHDFLVLILTLDLGAELAIATAIVSLFSFAAYYEVPIVEPLRALGLGFCLYSCVHALNNLVLQRFMNPYAAVWNLVGTLTFFASVTIWLRACLKAAPAAETKPVLLDATVYPTLMPEVNGRLISLNEGLSKLWMTEPHHR